MRVRDQSVEASFRAVLEDSRPENQTALMATGLVASALSELVGRDRVLYTVMDVAAGPGVVHVGDFVLHITMGAAAPADLRACASLVREGYSVEWLVPHAVENRARELLCKESRPIWVGLNAIESYLSLRVLFTSMDRSQSSEQTLRGIIASYNLDMKERGFDDCVRIRVGDD